MKLYGKKFEDRETLNKAREMLYRYYVQELHWKINIENQSGIKTIKTSRNQMMLVDDYDNNSDWFGVFYQKDIIACARIIDHSQYPVELSRYSSAAKIMKDIILHEKIAELNREAIDSRFANIKKVYCCLFKTILDYCLLKNKAVITTSNLTSWQAFYKEIRLSKLQDYSFKYEPTDHKEVDVYFAENDEISTLIKTIEMKEHPAVNTKTIPLHLVTE